MGTTSPRFWDTRDYSSRPARPDDPRAAVFDAYIPHPVKGWTPVLSASTWQRASAAAQRCLDLQRGTHGPLPAEWLLNRAESIASSSIEGIRPSARRVARAEAQLTLFGERPPPAEMQTLRNIDVTRHALALAESDTDLTVDALRQLHTTLMGDDDPIAGQIRSRQNWVGAGQLGGPLEAHHVGPPPEAVPALLDDLIAYINHRDDGMPVVRAAVAHAQFETIHPFADGNGRTGRAVLQYMYRRDGLSTTSALPISTALMLTRRDYFGALDTTRVVCEPDAPERSHGLRPWVEQLAAATDHACRLYERLNTHVEALLQRWTSTARINRIRPSSAASRLLALLPAHPVVTADHAGALLQTSERTARNAVARLAAAGILVQRSAGRRNRVLECADMMDAFTEAAREQPADNLTLARPEPTGQRTVAPAAPQLDAQHLCNAPTNRGGNCRHPRPRPYSSCPAGHQHPADE